MTDNEKARLKELAEIYKLTKDHFYVDKRGFIVITRPGIEVIQNTEEIDVIYEMTHFQADPLYVVVKATAMIKDGRSVQSFGEASLANNKNSYPVAMAEKRALSRVVLKATKFYSIQNVYGEDELD
jgi:hypothetical protein